MMFFSVCVFLDASSLWPNCWQPVLHVVFIDIIQQCKVITCLFLDMHEIDNPQEHRYLSSEFETYRCILQQKCKFQVSESRCSIRRFRKIREFIDQMNAAHLLVNFVNNSSEEIFHKNRVESVPRAVLIFSPGTVCGFILNYKRIRSIANVS